MSEDVTKNPSGVQAVCFVVEAMAVLDEADKAGLTRPEDQPKLAELRGRIALGISSDRGAQEALNRLLAAGAAAKMALDATTQVFVPGDVIELRALDPAAGGGVSLCGRLDDPQERAALETFICDRNGFQNLYVGVDPRRADMAGLAKAGSAADVVAFRSIALDFDKKDGPPADPDWTRTVAELKALDPALIVNSGNGVQVWFRVDAADTEIEATVAPIKAAMATLGADDTSDLPRVMRLPFTVNLPTKTKRARGNVPCLAVSS